MPNNIINPIIIAEDGYAGPGPGVNNFHPVIEAGNVAPGIGLAASVPRAFSPGAGIDNFHTVVEAQEVAPGYGIGTESPVFKKPPSVSEPNQTFAGRVVPGQGIATDHNLDTSNDFSQDGPVKIQLNTETALGRIAGGLMSPGGAVVNVVQNNVVGQVLGVGLPVDAKGGIR